MLQFAFNENVSFDELGERLGFRVPFKWYHVMGFA